MSTPEEAVRKFRRPLPVEMTPEEKIKRGHKAGMLKKAIAKVRIEMKAATTTHKEQLKEHQANLDAILTDLESGTEIRQVECFERRDFQRKKVEVVRADTGTVEETRAMDLADLAHDPNKLASVPASKDNGKDAEVIDMPKRKRGRPRKTNTPEANA